MIDLYAESWESVLPRPALIEGRRRSVSTAGTPRLVLRYSTRALRSSVSILWNTIISRAIATGRPKAMVQAWSAKNSTRRTCCSERHGSRSGRGAASISSRGDQGPASVISRALRRTQAPHPSGLPRRLLPWKKIRCSGQAASRVRWNTANARKRCADRRYLFGNA